MALCGMLFKQLLFGVLILAAVAAPETNSRCNRTCGSVSIPYPFGTGEDCYLDPSFLITCDATFNPPKPFLNTSTIDVLDISLDGELQVLNLVAKNCDDRDLTKPWFRLGKFVVSSNKNKFTAVGCNTVAYIEGRTTKMNFTTGCVSRCDSIDSVVNGSCNGVGCCQSSVPENITFFNLFLATLNNNDQSHNNCSFAFLVEEKAYKFSSLDLNNWRHKRKVPVVLDWAVGKSTCQEAQKNRTRQHLASVTIPPMVLGIAVVASLAMEGTHTSPMVAQKLMSAKIQSPVAVDNNASTSRQVSDVIA